MLEDAERALLHRLGERDERLAEGAGEADGHVREGLDAAHEHQGGLVLRGVRGGIGGGAFKWTGLGWDRGGGGGAPSPSRTVRIFSAAEQMPTLEEMHASTTVCAGMLVGRPGACMRASRR